MHKGKLFIIAGLLQLLLFPVFTYSQQPPTGIKWYSIKTPQFRIVFHEGLEEEATRTANLMEYIADKVPAPYNFKPRRINLYLNSMTAVSNGYVTLAPRHMHFFAHPPQDVHQLGNADWLSLLAIHEYRHVAQFDFLDRNHFQVAYALAGDMGKNLMNMLFVPIWYYEGDAITAETSLTSFGRGRMASFEMPVRAIVEDSNQRFTYDQAYLQSYRRFFPNHYYLGYFMHRYVGRNHGYEVWPMVLNRVTNIRTFSGSIKQMTGLDVKNTFHNTLSELENEWHTEPLPHIISSIALKHTDLYTNYRYGHRMPDGSVIAVKYGLGNARELVKIDNDGTEKRLRGLNSDSGISTNGRYITWSSFTPHPRWGLKDYTDIIVMDSHTGKTNTITSGNQYLSPAISPDGKLIAAVKYDESLSYNIDILDAATGEVKNTIIINKGAGIPRNPLWSDNNTEIVYTLDAPALSSVMITNIFTMVTRELSFDKQENIASPLLHDDKIYFISDAQGTNDLHCLDLTTNQRYIALQGGFGFFNPRIAAGTSEMIIEGYTAQGYRLYSWDTSGSNLTPYQKATTKQTRDEYAREKNINEDILAVYNETEGTYAVKRYNHLLNGMKLHSWYFLPANQGVSVTAMMSDPLSIHNLSASLEYNHNESTTNQSLIYTMSKYYPVFKLGLLNGRRTMNYNDPDSEEDVTYYQWDEQSLAAGISLPLDFTREDFNHTVTLSSDINYTFINGLQSFFRNDYEMGNGRFLSGGALLSWQGYREMSPRDFYPSLGFRFNTYYNTTLQTSQYMGKILGADATAFLPGLLSHHSLRLKMSYEEQLPDFDPEAGYIFPSQVLYFRGYENEFNLQNFIASADYSFPLLYPDLSLGSVLYCKRIRTNLFGDYGIVKTLDYAENKASYGVDLLFDLHFFRVPVEIDLGVRFAQTIENRSKLELLMYQRF